MNKAEFKADKDAMMGRIMYLLEKRKSLPPFDPEHLEINKKLDKLYYHWKIMLEQENN